MINRRQLMGIVPASAVFFSVTGTKSKIAAAELSSSSDDSLPLIASPPVVQNPRADGFGVSIAVNRMATVTVEYGFESQDLRYRAQASHHGLVIASDKVLHVRVHHTQSFSSETLIYYRIVAQSLTYRNAYELNRGQPEASETYALKLPGPGAKNVRIVSVNDTHENLSTIKRLHDRIDELDPDALIWNGDTCNDFDQRDRPEQILLNPAKDPRRGWACTRPLLFSNGNHDVRGQRAREVVHSFAGCPESTELPYNQAIRIGPLAIITLDTGEDKPDHHPVFAGTAAYQPYRQQQASWLAQTIRSPDIEQAKFKIAAAHIPLRGLPGQPDGTTLVDYARYSGFGARLWLPILREAGFDAILAGHTHAHRHDQPSNDCPIHQFVGGGPKPAQATLTVLDATNQDGRAELEVRVVDLENKTLHQHQWTA